MTLYDLAVRFNDNPVSDKIFFNAANDIILSAGTHENKDNPNSFEYIRYNLVDTRQMSLQKYGLFSRLFEKARDIKANQHDAYYDELVE